MTHILSDPKTLVLTWLSPTHLALKVGWIKWETYVIAAGSSIVRQGLLLEWGQGKEVLKFTTSEEMLPRSSSSQSWVSSCEVYTWMMHFIWSLRTVEERSVCSPSSPGGAGRPTVTWGRTEKCQQLTNLLSLFHSAAVVGFWLSVTFNIGQFSFVFCQKMTSSYQ